MVLADGPGPGQRQGPVRERELQPGRWFAGASSGSLRRNHDGYAQFLDAAYQQLAGPVLVDWEN